MRVVGKGRCCAPKGHRQRQHLAAIEAIQDYDPEPGLDRIKAKVLLVNDAEDYANPPDLGTVERAMQRVKHGRYVLIPPGPDTKPPAPSTTTGSCCSPADGG